MTTGQAQGFDALTPLDRTQLQAYRYVTVEEAASYLAVLDVFTEGVAGLLSDLSAAEVQAALSDRGLDLDLETVDSRLSYLVDHGNLIRSPREAEARTIREYLTARARFQVAPLGEIVHRQVLDLLGTAGQAREVSTEVLPELLRGLRALAEPSTATAGLITTLFAAHQQLVQSTRAFYVGLGEALSRVDLDTESLAAYREMLIDYLQRFVEDVRRYQPLIVAALDALDLDELLAATAGGPRLRDATGRAARRAAGLQREDWAGLDAWFRGAPTRASDADEVRALATRAMGALLGGLRRTVGGTGERSRRADLLRLAGAFDRADDVTAHRLWVRAFGLYPARHLSALPEVEDVPPTTSWWDAPPADVPLSLREFGDRAQRGRSGRREDFAVSRRRRIAERERELQARSAALEELRSLAGGVVGDAQLSDAARGALLDLYAEALASAGGPLPAGGVAINAGGLRLHVTRRQGTHTAVRSAAGVLRLLDLELEVSDVTTVARAGSL